MSESIVPRFAPVPVLYAEERELPELLSREGLTAVWVRRERAPWLDELGAAVEAGSFHIPRAELDGMSLEKTTQWLEKNLPSDPVSSQTRDALLSDILSHCHLLEWVTGARALRMRIFTGKPDRRCGFHVDTVRPGASVWGMLRVYNGAVTRWLEPHHIRSMADFYIWLHRRDRVVRELAKDSEARDKRVSEMDSAPSFLIPDASIQQVPADVTVVFRHLDASAHWDARGRGAAWMHCSPMAGRRRLVLNLSPA